MNAESSNPPPIPPIIRRPTPAQGVPLAELPASVSGQYPETPVVDQRVSVTNSIPPNASIIVPPPASAVVQVMDRLGDIVGVLVIGWLAAHRIVDGTFACGIILAVLGVQSGFRQFGRRAGTIAGVGVAGAIALAFIGRNIERLA